MNNKMKKRIISIVLSLLMVVGLLNGVGLMRAKAVEGPEVTLDLLEANGSWTFEHSELSAEYQGDSTSWTPVRYQVSAYKDGAAVPENIWIEFVGEKAYIWGDLHYADGVVPSASLYIPSGTKMVEINYNSNDKSVTVVENGKSMILAKELNIVYNTTTALWEQQGVRSPKEVSLELLNAGSSWTFNHSTLPEEYQGNSASWTPVRYQFAAYVDGATEAATGMLEFVGAEAYIWGATFFPNGTLPTESFVIPKDALLRECTENNGNITLVEGGKTLKLKAELRCVYDQVSGQWKQEQTEEPPVEPEEPPVEPEPPADAPRVSLGFKEVYENSATNKGWILTFDKPEMKGTGYYTISKVVIDGVVSSSVKIEMPSWTNEESADWAYIYYNLFPSQAMPASSFIVPAGAMLTNDSTGSIYVVESDLEVTLTEEGWVSNEREKPPVEPPIEPEPPVDPEPPVKPEVPADAPKVTMGFKEVYDNSETNKGWILTFDRFDMKGTGFYTISFMKIDGQEAADVLIEMPTWTNEESADWAYIYFNCFPGQQMPTGSLVIEKDTILTNVTTGDIYVVDSTLEVTLTEDGWVSNEPEKPPVEPEPPVNPEPEFPVTPPADAEKVLIDFREVYENSETNKGWILTFNVPEMKGTGYYSISKVLIDGQETSGVKIEMPTWTNEQSADWAYIYHNLFSEQKMPEKSFIIPKGTMLVNDSTGKVYVVAATLEVKYKNNKWESNHPYVIPDVRNDIRITFDKFDGQGYYLNVKIVAGPDAGKNIADVYGDWVSTPPTGKFTFVRNGLEEKMDVLWCPCNKNQLYVIGNYRNYVTELTNVIFSKNTIISPQAKKYSKVPMRIINDVKLEKEPEYGLWGLEGKVKTPTEFCDVKISVKEIKGHALTLSVAFADGTEKSLGEVYGYGASLYGAVKLEEPGIGKYTDQAAVYSVQDNTFRLFGIYPAVKDSIKISAGTVLFEHNACETSVPIRIVNTVTLTRDEEDEWVYKTDTPLDFAGSVSPQTGDDFSVMPYVVLLFASVMVIAGAGVYKKRAMKQKSH